MEKGMEQSALGWSGFAVYHGSTPTGEVTEWSIVLVSKTRVPARVPRVRIPASPL